MGCEVGTAAPTRLVMSNRRALDAVAGERVNLGVQNSSPIGWGGFLIHLRFERYRLLESCKEVDHQLYV
jgi:hypothetical protein